MADDELSEMSRDELEQLVRSLRAELGRLREELRRSLRDRHETPPHWQ